MPLLALSPLLQRTSALSGAKDHAGPKLADCSCV